MATLPFPNRTVAAQYLAAALDDLRGQRPLVLAIPRGAVPMARVLADALGGDLDVVLVKKLGAPGNPEFAIGSVDEQGNIVLNENAQWFDAGAAYVRAEAARQQAAMQARRARYGGRAGASVAGRTVVLVDDGLATGATMAAALRAVRRQGPARLICAVPVASRDALALVEPLADATVCLATPSPFGAVGRFYRDFSEVRDDEVIAALAGAPARAANPGLAGAEEIAISIPAGATRLDADLALPPAPRGLVLFAHGSGSSRRSARNRAVARALNGHGFATLLFDLLTEQENQDPAARFDVPLLARRLRAAVDWTGFQPLLATLPLGLFGASTGAAAALRVAAAEPARVAAVVSRGGRPDMAGPQALAEVRSPTLLIVGGDDHPVLELNRLAGEAMGEYAELAVVPGATHLFEEPGTLDQVAALAAGFFARWLPAALPRRSATG